MKATYKSSHLRLVEALDVATVVAEINKYAGDLRSLSLDRCTLEHLHFLKKAPPLGGIIVHQCAISRSDTFVLPHATTIQHLNTNGTKLQSITANEPLANLRKVIIHSTGLGHLDWLDSAVSLCELHAFNNPIRQVKTLRSFPDLVSIDLSNTLIDTLEDLAACELSEVNVASTFVRDFEILADLEDLMALDVSNTDLDSLECIKNTGDLRVLKINNTQVNDLSALTSHTFLRHLELANTSVQSLEPLAQCPNIESLTIVGTNAIDLSPLDHLVSLNELRVDEALKPQAEALKATLPALHVAYYGLSSYHHLTPEVFAPHRGLRTDI